MDFVVVGFGLGALALLLGLGMLGGWAGRSERAAARAPSPEHAARHRATAAELRGGGQALLYAGGALLLATIGGLAGSLDDRTGALLVATTGTVGALGILVWGYLHRARHPLPRRPPRAAPEPMLPGPVPPVSLPLLSIDELAPGEVAGANGEEPVAEAAGGAKIVAFVAPGSRSDEQPDLTGDDEEPSPSR